MNDLERIADKISDDLRELKDMWRNQATKENIAVMELNRDLKDMKALLEQLVQGKGGEGD